MPKFNIKEIFADGIVLVVLFICVTICIRGCQETTVEERRIEASIKLADTTCVCDTIKPLPILKK